MKSDETSAPGRVRICDTPQLDTSLSPVAQFFDAARSWLGRDGDAPEPDIVDFAAPYTTLAEAWARCWRPDWRLWMLQWAGAWGLCAPVSDRDLRLFACWCARRTVRLLPYNRWTRTGRAEREGDRELFGVVTAAKKCAEGLMSREQMLAIREPVLNPCPEAICILYEPSYRSVRAALFGATNEDPFRGALTASWAAMNLAHGASIRTRIRRGTNEERSDKVMKLRRAAAEREAVAHVRRLRLLFPNTFTGVDSQAMVKVAKAIGIRAWDCWHCGARTSEVVERPDGTFRRCVECKALAQQLG